MEAPRLFSAPRRALRGALAAILACSLGSGTIALADARAAGAQPLPDGQALVIRDIPYGERDGVTLRLDVYRMGDAEKDPVLVLVHGGSWRRRSKDIWSSLGPRYAEAGYVVLAIEYRLAPPRSKPVVDREDDVSGVRVARRQ